MKKQGLQLKIFSGAVFLILSFLLVSSVLAQTAPEFMITWKAVNYVPADYLGKTLPSASSFVEAGMDVLDKGKTVDLSKSIISWYANNNIVGFGVGLKTMKFNVASAQSVVVRVVIADYNGAEISDSFLVPIQKNEMIISAKTPSNNVFRNRIKLSATSHTIQARPFFFNVKDLSGLRFTWKINDKIAGGTVENPDFLTLDLKSEGVPQETELSVSAGVSNLSNQLEIGSRTLNFIVK